MFFLLVLNLTIHPVNRFSSSGSLGNRTLSQLLLGEVWSWTVLENVPEKGRGFMLYDSVKEAAEMNCRSSKRNIFAFLLIRSLGGNRSGSFMGSTQGLVNLIQNQN